MCRVASQRRTRYSCLVPGLRKSIHHRSRSSNEYSGFWWSSGTNTNMLCSSSRLPAKAVQTCCHRNVTCHTSKMNFAVPSENRLSILTYNFHQIVHHETQNEFVHVFYLSSLHSCWLLKFPWAPLSLGPFAITYWGSFSSSLYLNYEDSSDTDL